MNDHPMLPSYFPLFILSFWWIREAVGLTYQIVFSQKEQTRKSVKINAVLLLLALTGCLLLAEITSVFFIDQSDSLNISFVSRQWFNRHWQPINAKGFRSREENKEEIIEKRTILILGDSFAAGHGIKNYQDTFPEILANSLGQSFYVLNYSQCGWDTADELNVIENIDFSPEFVILSYLPNDIISVASRMDFAFDWEYITPQSTLWTWCVNNSYFANYLHFSTVLGIRSEQTYSQFIKNLLKCHQDPEISQEHQMELRSIARICSDKGSHLIVVVWPFFSLLEESTLMTQNLNDALEDIPHKKIMVANEIRDWQLEESIVSGKDPHPSQAAHSYVATLLEQQILKP